MKGWVASPLDGLRDKGVLKYAHVGTQVCAHSHVHTHRYIHVDVQKYTPTEALSRPQAAATGPEVWVWRTIMPHACPLTHSSSCGQKFFGGPPHS